MATDKDILEAALTHMASLVTSLPIAWPGVSFTPPSSGMWFEVRHFPNEPDHFGYGDDAKQDYRGFLQVSVFTADKAGLITPTEEAEKIVAHFAKGTALGPVVVRKTPYLSPPIPEDNHIQIPVTCPYRGIA